MGFYLGSLFCSTNLHVYPYASITILITIAL